MTLLGLFGAPLSFSTLIVTLRPGNCAHAPRRYARDYCAQCCASTKLWYVALIKGLREPWTSRGENVQFAGIFASLRGKRMGKFCRAMVLLKQLAQAYRQVFPEFLKSCPNLSHFVRLSKMSGVKFFRPRLRSWFWLSGPCSCSESEKFSNINSDSCLHSENNQVAQITKIVSFLPHAS